MRMIIPSTPPTAFQIAVIVSQFNEEISRGLFRGAITQWEHYQFSQDKMTVVYVPGAIEIGLMAQQLAKTSRYKAIVCLGAVIQGDTDHYRYVCAQVSESCQRVALESQTPVIFGVLTTQTIAQAKARSAQDGHNKGREAIKAAVDMVSVLQQISEDVT